MTDSIEIKGVDYPVRFTLGALAKFEAKTKINALALSDPSKLGSDAACYLIWCGLQAGAKVTGDDFTFKAGDLADELTLADVVRAFDILTAEIIGEKKV
jgi:hypothetical protein